MKWKYGLPIKGFENYEASNDGRIRNSKTGRVLHSRSNGKGYLKVALHNNNIRTDKYVHRLVADAFYDGRHNDLDVNHIDGCKTNNHIGNLEFYKRSENLKHAYKIGLSKSPIYNSGGRKIKVKVLETGEVFNSLRECSRKLHISHERISDALKGKINSVNGYHFEKI